MLDHGTRDFRNFFNQTKKEVTGDRNFKDFFKNNNK